MTVNGGGPASERHCGSLKRWVSWSFSRNLSHDPSASAGSRRAPPVAPALTPSPRSSRGRTACRNSRIRRSPCRGRPTARLRGWPRAPSPPSQHTRHWLTISVSGHGGDIGQGMRPLWGRVHLIRASRCGKRRVHVARSGPSGRPAMMWTWKCGTSWCACSPALAMAR